MAEELTRNANEAGGPRPESLGNAPEGLPARGASRLTSTKTLAQHALTALSPKQGKEALAEFRRLCLSTSEEPAALDSMEKRLREADYKQEMTQVLVETLTAAEVNPHVGALWMRRIVTSKAWDRQYPKAMDELCARGEVGRRAVLEFLELVGKKRRASLIRRAARKHRKWLRADPRTRSITARALLEARCFREVIQWTSGWPDDLERDLSLAYYRAAALRGLGREGKAHQIIGVALAQPGALEQFPLLRLWYAAEEALAGNTDQAEAQFQEIKPAGWDEETFCLYYLVRGVIRVQRADKLARQEAFDASYARVRERCGRRIYRRNRSIRRAYRRCLWRMGMDSRNWTDAVLAAWRSADSWPLLLPLSLVPGLQVFLPLYLIRLLRRPRQSPA